MPRIKTELLQDGMVVASDVKNLDNMLLIPSGCKLTARHIGILQAWGVLEINVEATGEETDTDRFSRLPPEQQEKLQAEVRAQFWKADNADPVFAEIFRLIVRRRANRPSAQPT